MVQNWVAHSIISVPKHYLLRIHHVRIHYFLALLLLIVLGIQSHQLKEFLKKMILITCMASKVALLTIKM